MKTKLFISWSDDLSKKVGGALAEWIPCVFQSVEIFYSPISIEQGARWSREISQNLEDCDFGIICLTVENLKEPWLIFEAGALSKKINSSRVFTLLFGVKPVDIDGPLSQFQHTVFQLDNFRKLIKDVNKNLNDSILPDQILDKTFDTWWTQLDTNITRILEEHVYKNTDKKKIESNSEILQKLSEKTELNTKFLKSILKLNIESSEIISSGKLTDRSISWYIQPSEDAKQAKRLLEELDLT